MFATNICSFLMEESVLPICKKSYLCNYQNLKQIITRCHIFWPWPLYMYQHDPK